jgi:hypothetical protein
MVDQVQNVRAVGDICATGEAEPLVEPGGGGVRGAEPEAVEAPARSRDDLGYQLPADPQAPVRRQDVHVADAAHARAVA